MQSQVCNKAWIHSLQLRAAHADEGGEGFEKWRRLGSKGTSGDGRQADSGTSHAQEELRDQCRLLL